jgi:hypothetical protein
MAVKHTLLLLITIHDLNLHNTAHFTLVARKLCLLVVDVQSHFLFAKDNSCHVTLSNSAGTSFPIEHHQCPSRL